MLGIVFTTRHEAVPFLKKYDGVRPDALEPGTPIQVGDLLIATTGPGKINATLETERLLEAYSLDLLLHAGTCTGLDDDVSVGSVVGPSFVLEGDRVELEAPAYPRMPLECPLDVDQKGTLVSQDHHGRHTADEDDDSDGSFPLSYWERLADVRDETGYALAYVAAQHGTACHIVKEVSTHIHDEAAPSDASTQQAPEAAASVLQQFIKDVAEYNSD